MLEVRPHADCESVVYGQGIEASAQTNTKTIDLLQCYYFYAGAVTIL